ncbi:extracellular solute-binding protein [Testudinibacter aquarius]|uniref:sn-glycerol-3-phosphate-binding periplasmic protein UgpB n=1 Tax=Testudinibacter aquarius TaxID=1524974 RepID=A0A4R3YET3_9PAST|nr:extracellular solute-binding protein [Testudinibacter aquarius]KAE9529841.1 glycerol 3-phosphate ABC transporter substrate-binding protein [Testudinibacter aquarius]TCV89394.1 carbohydrate ABC transporter substrate-binding protein (CUT1 family) [Testudinibacter aquarius]TNG93172.1 extracellular solute-binding protein [Testudinibacter aquarius]
MLKKSILLTALASATVSFSASAATNATTVTWWHAMGGQLGETVNKMAAGYNASQNQCKIDPIYKGSYEELLTAGIAAFRAKQAPNIIQVYDAGSATIINAKGALIPVADLFAESGIEFDKNDYLPGVRNFYADSQGKMIGMPFNSSAAILYYNKAALEKAGVQPPKTWEAFEAIAEKLKQAGYTALSQSHSPWILFESFHSRNNLPLADLNNGFDGPATKLNYNSPEMKMQLSKFKEWKDKGYYGYYGEGWGDNQTPFEKGEVAMWLGSSGSFGGIKSQADFEFGTTYLPYWDSITKGQEYHTFIGGAALFAFAGKAKAQNACTTDFFKFLSLPQTQADWHKETGYVPITTAAYEKVKAEGYYQQEPAAETGILQLNLPSGEWTKGYRLGFYPQIREVIRSEVTKVFTGTTTVDQALSVIEKDGNQLLSRFAQTVK